MKVATVLRRVRPRSVRFLLVGAVGFVVDGTVLLLLVHALGASKVWSRVPSFMIAVTATWWLHRHYTFGFGNENAPSIREWSRFVLANALGNGFNLCLYWMLVGMLRWEPIAALTAASAIAVGINYTASARWVFKNG